MSWLIILAAMFSMSLGAAAQEAGTTLQVPAPTGKYAVGRRRFLWFDEARSHRPVHVDVWYPSEPSAGPDAAYFPDFDVLAKIPSMALAMERMFGTASFTLQLGELRSNAHENTLVAHAKHPFAVLLFSHGLGGSPYHYSMQLEDLASHGYVIVAPEHIHDSFAVVLPGGQVTPFSVELWGQYPASSSSAATVGFYAARASIWADDLLFARDQLLALSKDRSSPFYGVLDFKRTGAFGHSQGGRSAATACMIDSRIKACLNEDGRFDEIHLQCPYWPISGHRIHGVFAMFDWFDPGLDQQDFAGMHTTLAGYAKLKLKAEGAALDSYRAPAGGSYHLTLLQPGMLHSGFTDLPWLAARSERNRARLALHTTTIRQEVRAFFDHVLQGEPSAWLACDAEHEGLLVQCYEPSERNERH